MTMAVPNGVSESLLAHIRSLMELECLSRFNLGGGTSLAIKYNHRVSTDIDLFSPGVVGTKSMQIIAQTIKNKLNPDYIKILNESQDNLCFLRVILPPDETKVEIIQNLKNIFPHQSSQGIRLIQDDDIGALKLLSDAGRGVQKDFYDLHLLTEMKPLSHYLDHLFKYYAKNKNSPANIFDNIGALGSKVGFDLTKDLSPLCNFNHAGDKRNSSNRIILTEKTPINIPWPVLRDKWKAKVVLLAKDKEIFFKETPRIRKPKYPGGWLN